MNILYFLTPKSDVVCINENSTLRQALEKMEHSGYTALPIIDEEGMYIGTVTEGDLLWNIKEQFSLSLKDAEGMMLSDVKRKKNNYPVHINSDIEDLISKVINQNFVPVIDDRGMFIGIITRKDVIIYLYGQNRTAVAR